MLNYIDRGDGAPVVLVHGFSDQSVSWFLADRNLFSTHRVVAVDLPGHGHSEPWKGESLTVHDMSEELHKVVRNLEMGRFALVGHSMGGMLAQQYCLEHPQDLSGLFICCTAARGALLAGTAFNLEGMREDISKLGLVKALSADPYAAFAPGFDSPIVKQYLEMEFSTDEPTAVKCIDAMKGWRLDKGLATGYPGPTVIVCGEKDRITPSSFAMEVAEAFPGSTVETIKGAGHMVFLEKPTEFESLVEKHLTNLG